MSKKALQNRDGTFKAVSFGKTMFCGSSVMERETIVARAFDICVLVEGKDPNCIIGCQNTP